MQRSLKQNGATAHQQLLDRVDVMMDQANRLGMMLNRLLDLSKVEAGRLELSFERTNLVAVIRGVISGIETLSDVHRIVLDTPAELEGHWDAARLAQVVQNLITNAIKYSPEGGRIVVTVTADDCEVSVAVRDEGLGIPADDLPQLFERFYRVAGTRGLEGSGLGLYICQGIISAHGGRIWATSEGPGRGSTFWFTLPRVLDCHGS
jgi:signal transduction histidine kinase